ncbi:MAG TPA: EF-hand domain-containing protein [Burkholderiaceae bacterium]|nr:EF-hand domain-containing protein [Burkholderiaceae bacterium]
MKKSLLASALVALAPAMVMAQAGNQGMTYEQFNHLDTDGSGTVSEAEYYHFMEGAFKELDKNRNNSLSPDETSHILSQEQFSQMDANGNGRVSRQEFLDQVMADFHRHDSDGDGQLRP